MIHVDGVMNVNVNCRIYVLLVVYSGELGYNGQVETLTWTSIAHATIFQVMKY